MSETGPQQLPATEDTNEGLDERALAVGEAADMALEIIDRTGRLDGLTAEQRQAVAAVARLAAFSGYDKGTIGAYSDALSASRGPMEAHDG